MNPSRTLFVIASLPRHAIAVRGIANGNEAVSGSLSSTLLVADELARRGRAIGVLALDGNHVTETESATFADFNSALSWHEGGTVVLSSWGDSAALGTLTNAGLCPLVWLHTHIGPDEVRGLNTGAIRGLLTVSDLARLPFLHLPFHRRIGRIYNCLNPFYSTAFATVNSRFDSQHVIFTGYFGESKGTHRVLQAWPHVLDRLPRARLTIAGSAILYGRDRQLGNLGLASPEFEDQYLMPLLNRFGSWEACGITFTGMLSPAKLAALYNTAALGLINPNWTGSTETFCCTGVEMIAAGLPIVAVARGGLPETVGTSSGCTLVRSPRISSLATAIISRLLSPERPAAAAAMASSVIRSKYSLSSIADRWEHMLGVDPDDLDSASGRWGYRGRKSRLLAERTAAALGLGAPLDQALSFARRLRHG